MLFLPSSVRLSHFPLLSSHGVSSDGRVKSSEETLIGSDFSLSRLLPPLLYPRSYLTTTFLKSSPLDLELGCPRKYFRVDAIRRRENLPHPGFLHLFPVARPSPLTADWPTLSLSDLDVHRAYGPRSRNFSSTCFAFLRQSVLLSFSSSV